MPWPPWPGMAPRPPPTTSATTEVWRRSRPAATPTGPNSAPSDRRVHRLRCPGEGPSAQDHARGGATGGMATGADSRQRDPLPDVITLRELQPAGVVHRGG